jgi:hypothetical protein
MAITTFEIDVNTGDSVKSLSDLRNEFKDIQKQLSGLTPGTEEYVNALKRLGQVKDDIGDLKDEINAFAGADKKIAAVTNVVGGLAGGFQAAQGAAALFGADNEALNETMVKLQATMAITQGIQGLAGMGDSLKVVGNLLKSTTIGTYLATAAQKLYNLALKDNPIGWLIAGLTALVGVIALVVNAMGDETEAMEKSIKQREKELELMNEAAEKLKAENKFRLDLAAAQGKSAAELAAINEAQSANEIKSIDKRVQALKQEILERSNLMKQRDGEELKKLQEANSKSLDEMKKLATERLNIQNSLKIQEAKLETDANKESEEKAKEADAKAKERAKKKADDDLAAAEKWRQEQAKFIQYEIDALNNKYGEEEQIIAEQQLATKIQLGTATPDEISAWNAFRLSEQQKYNNEVDAELKRLKDIADKKRLDEDAAEKLKQENLKKAKEQEVQLTLQGLQTIQSLADSFAGKSQESQKRAFQIKKAASLAQATIETYQAAQSAYASQMTIPTPDAPIRANIAAAIAIASGLARVAVIAKTKFEGGGAGATGGGGGGNLGSFSQGGGGQPPQGLTAQNTVTQLNPDGSVAGQGERNAAPMKAYVVESESRAVTERVNKLSNNSKIG